MRFLSYARTSEQLLAMRAAGLSEVILEHVDLGRLGTLDTPTLEKLALHARQLDLRPILEWDILMTTPSFEKALHTLSEIDLDLFEAVRVQDPGAYETILTQYPQLPIQLILETGNHNLTAIQNGCQLGAGRVERVVLSIELPKDRIAHAIQNLSVPVEILGLGPILLLYTPRHLLSNREKTTAQWLQEKARSSELSPLLSAIASGDEGHHQDFRVVENTHGTFLFHPKDYNLIEKRNELRDLGLHSFRVDLRLTPHPETLLASFPEDLSSHPQKFTHCFYQANATDVLFKKLKNTTIQRHDAQYIGEVVESAKGSHVIIHVLGKNQSIQKGQSLRWINPQGQVFDTVVEKLINLDAQEVSKVSQGDYAVLPYLKKITAKTAVYHGCS